MNYNRTLTPAHLKRYNSSIYAIYELIKSYKIDNYEFITDTLLQSYYSINNIADSIDDYVRECEIKAKAGE